MMVDQKTTKMRLDELKKQKMEVDDQKKHLGVLTKKRKRVLFSQKLSPDGQFRPEMR